MDQRPAPPPYEASQANYGKNIMKNVYFRKE